MVAYGFAYRIFELIVTERWIFIVRVWIMELCARVGLVGALVGELAEVVEREVDGLLTNVVVAARQRV